jgi:predicted RNA-binding Zn-ribbon protein involved in translation (DUF1610 family)
MAIYRAAVIPVLLYGSEVWVMSMKEAERLETFQMKCLRRILGITKFHHERNEDVRLKTGQCEISELVTRSRLRWLGHVARMGEGRLPVKLLYGSMEGKGRRGKPVSRWKDMIERDLKKRKVQSWYKIVQDRTEWRKIVHGDISGVVKKGRQKDKNERKNEASGDGGGVAAEHRKEGLVCPKCGKVYNTRKGGWFDKHIRECMVVKEWIGLDGGYDGGDGAKSTALICPKCGKEYRSKKGGWFTKHLQPCGASS